ncbi:MAG: UPF0280 family protein [Deltaproteobacteria bacterium]|nr:UPF0280 family protein [Deltaproteobacteria bacterium]
MYRLTCRGAGLSAFTARVKETDLWVLAEKDLTARTVEIVLHLRRALELYIADHPLFLTSLVPLPDDPLAPPLAQAMLTAGRLAGTGPMAAVAGAIAQEVAQRLQAASPRVAVENGGDLYLATGQDLTVGLAAGESPLSGRLGLVVPAGEMPLALGTSSGTVGHSLSLGRADAATILAKDGALADAAATALGNRLARAEDLAPALEWAAGVPGVLGAVAVFGEHLAAWGRVNLVELGSGAPPPRKPGKRRK